MKGRTEVVPPDLAPGEVHLWWARVDPETPSDDDLLDPAERERAARFWKDRDRRRFAGRRAFLRRMLGTYLGLEPASLVFVEGEHGKPVLERRRGQHLSFNLSHADGRVLLGLSRERELGVDVEAHRLRTEVDRMARQVFTTTECTSFDGLEHELRTLAFFRAWTRKEAALKATGEGFAREPRTLEVGLAPRATGEVWTPPSEPVLSSYGLTDLDAPDGFSASVCARGHDWRPVVVRPWEEAVPA
jgi:4'-phosphopantetheinyl transferase